jgi:2-oxoisovalerate dehydrogenase E1 component
VSELIYQSYRDLLAGDATAVVLGEDVEYTTPWTPKPYGGAFKATRDLSELFPGRVRNTPISEAAVVGVGTGLALGGMKPSVEIMFGDFLTLAFDQLLNHACKFCDMYGRAVNVPLVVRTPMGGRRGYGPTHSQSLERHFLGIPNLSIVALNRRVSPRELYAAVHRIATHPVLVIENKVLYTRPLASDGIAGFECQQSDEALPTLRITPRGGVAPDVTIACYGGMLDEAETALGQALDELELVGEVLCPTRIHPLNIEPFVESVTRTGRLLIVEEGGSFAAWGSEIAARLAERGVALQWFRRLGCDGTIPCSSAAERSALPSADDMIVLLRELVGER